VNLPTPAIVAQSAVRRLPRPALLLLCVVYVLAGFWDRAPWKSQDLEALGYMLQLAQPALGETANWFKPSLLGQHDPQLALLPFWLGAGFLQWAPAGWEVAFSRLPFIGMLGLTLAATWYAVYAMARHLNAHFADFGLRCAPIPEPSITKAPSAELRPDQTDQDSLPAYEDLDRIVTGWIEHEGDPAAIAQDTGLDVAMVTRWCQSIDRAQFKRDQAPLVLKVAARTFGRGRPMPIAARWRPA
jgi:hypothetical protein